MIWKDDGFNTWSKRIVSWLIAVVITMSLVPESLAVSDHPKTGIIYETSLELKGEIINQRGHSMVGSGGGAASSEQVPFNVDILVPLYYTSDWEPIPIEIVKKINNNFDEWKDVHFGYYEKKLRAIEGFEEHRVPFCARVWYCRNESEIVPVNGKKLSFDLTEEEIIEYAKGGKNENVFCDDEGNPMVWLVVNDKQIEDRVRKGFEEAVEWYKENKMPDMLESVAENGMSVYYAARFFPDNSSSLVVLDRWGQVTANMDYNNVKETVDESIRNITIENLWVEPYGIKLAQVLEASKAYLTEKMNVGYGEVLKSLIAGYVAREFSENNDEILNSFSESFFNMADTFADMYSGHGVTTNGYETRKLLWLMTDFIRVPGLGSLKNVPELMEVISKPPARKRK